VISALDSAVLNPSYKAGLVRSAAMSDLKEAEAQASLPSVALGRLGPPELSKLLFEAQLLKETFESLTGTLRDASGQPRSAEAISSALSKRLSDSAVRTVAPSVGIPILTADGGHLLRGPRINVPELKGYEQTVSLTDRIQVNRWAKKGWIDLRPENMEVWRSRLERMVEARLQLRDVGSAAASIHSYIGTEFEIGEVVAWIFNNEMGGYRIK
jgi:hypothetical protein